MANGDTAAAAGMDILIPTVDKSINGADEINKTRDYIAEHMGQDVAYADTAGHATTAGTASSASISSKSNGSDRPRNYTVGDGPPGTIYAVWIDAANNFARNTSARKYKTDISSFETAVETFKQLEAVLYRRKHSGEGEAPLELGLIADDVAELYPELVIHHAGEIDGLRYDLLGVVLIPIIQQLIDRVEQLERSAE